MIMIKPICAKACTLSNHAETNIRAEQSKQLPSDIGHLPSARLARESKTNTCAALGTHMIKIKAICAKACTLSNHAETNIWAEQSIQFASHFWQHPPSSKLAWESRTHNCAALGGHTIICTEASLWVNSQQISSNCYSTVVSARHVSQKKTDNTDKRRQACQIALVLQQLLVSFHKQAKTSSDCLPDVCGTVANGSSESWEKAQTSSDKLARLLWYWSSVAFFVLTIHVIAVWMPLRARVQGLYAP